MLRNFRDLVTSCTTYGFGATERQCCPLFAFSHTKRRKSILSCDKLTAHRRILPVISVVVDDPTGCLLIVRFFAMSGRGAGIPNLPTFRLWKMSVCTILHGWSVMDQRQLKTYHSEQGCAFGV